MKALGAGTALTIVGGAGTAAVNDGSAGNRSVQTNQETAETGSVYTVRTLIGPPTNPERPADFFYQPTGLSVDVGDVVQFVFETPDHNVVHYHPAFGMRRRGPTGVSAFSSPLLGWRPDSIPGDQVEPPAEPGGGAGGEPGTETTAIATTDGNGATTDTPTGTDTPVGTDTPDGDGGSTATTDGTGGATATPGGASDGAGDGGPVPDSWLVAFGTPGVYDLLCSPHETYGMAMRVVVGEQTDAAFETSDPAALPEPRAGPVGLARVTLTDPALQPEAIVEQGQVPWESLEANQSDDGSTTTPSGE